MISLGIICYQGHSSSAALIKDGKILGAVSEERFSRNKFDDCFPAKSIEYLTKEFGIDFDDIDHIAVAWSPGLTLLGQLTNLHKKSLSYIFEKRDGSKKRSRFHKFFLISNLKNEIRKRYKFKNKITFIDHHLAHAISAFVQTEKADGITMIADGMGEFISTTLYEFKDHQYKSLYQDKFPHSLGVFYSAGTQFLGFVPDSDEFKVMGMAAYSTNEKYHARFSKLYNFKKNHLVLNLEYFDLHKKGNKFFSAKFHDLFSDVISSQDKMDFAFSLQTHLTKIVLNILELNSGLFNSRNFSAGGGVFLNCLLNQKLRDSTLFESYEFFPVADDNGTAIGAAQFIQMKYSKHKIEKLENLFLGPEINFINEDVFKDFHYKKIQEEKEVAQLLASGKVIAWVQGRMEFGHRSLGNRSILGDPRMKSMKDVINEKVKFRETYRPFAPSILEDKLKDYFYNDSNNNFKYPFMNETLNAREVTQKIAPAIVHEDGTSRVQTVSKSENPEFYKLISDFESLTGCPILLNTSFNINGMPIVLSVEDALDCFSRTRLDYLVIKDYLIWK